MIKIKNVQIKTKPYLAVKKSFMIPVINGSKEDPDAFAIKIILVATPRSFLKSAVTRFWMAGNMMEKKNPVIEIKMSIFDNLILKIKPAVKHIIDKHKTTINNFNLSIL